MTDTSIDVVLKIPFYIFSNANVSFLDRELIWRIYSIVKALPNTKKVQIINRKEFVKIIWDPNKKNFVVYIATATSEMIIYSEYKAQITLFKADKALVSISAEYLDFADVFFWELIAVLLKHIKINTYAIDLKKGK